MQITTLPIIGSWNKIEIRTHLHQCCFPLLMSTCESGKQAKRINLYGFLDSPKLSTMSVVDVFIALFFSSKAIISNVCCTTQFLKLTCFSLSQSEVIQIVGSAVNLQWKQLKLELLWNNCFFVFWVLGYILQLGRPLKAPSKISRSTSSRWTVREKPDGK